LIINNIFFYFNIYIYIFKILYEKIFKNFKKKKKIQKNQKKKKIFLYFILLISLFNIFIVLSYYLRINQVLLVFSLEDVYWK